VGLSAQSMSVASRQLGEQGLIRDDGRPLVPELFWELAKVWQPEKVITVGRRPTPSMFATSDRNTAAISDLFALADGYDAQGRLGAELSEAPYDLGRLVADVVRKEILHQPERAVRQMTASAEVDLDRDQVVGVLEELVVELR